MKISYRNFCYDPVSGRFIQKDPIGLAAGDTNLYRYVGNNPMNFSDPSGLYQTLNGSTCGGYLIDSTLLSTI